MATLDEKDIESVGAGEGRASTQSSKAYVNDEVTGFKDSITDDIKAYCSLCKITKAEK
jgi:hypothetical protein